MKFKPSYSRWTVFVLVALLPVASIGAYSFHTARRAIRQISADHSTSIAAIAGESLRQQLQRSLQLGRIIAGFPVFASAAEQRDTVRVRERLRRVVESSPEVDRAYVMDLDGVLWCDWPIAPESLNRSFAHRDYFTGIIGKWQPYVSEVFQRQAEPRPLVIAISTAIRNEAGDVVGILVLQHRLETVTRWLRRIQSGSGGTLIVLDHNGIVAGHSGMPKIEVLNEHYGNLDVVRQALRGTSTRLEYEDPFNGRPVIATFEPVRVSAERHWVVIAQQDMTQALLPVRELGQQITLAAVITAILALGAGILLARISERNRVMGLELAQRNEQLHEVIAAERIANEALKKAQAQMVQQEKLAGLGQMVAGIAHEINNPLSFVSNNTAVLQRDLLAVRDLLASYRDADDVLAAQRPELMQSIRERAERIDLHYALPNIEELLGRSREGLRRIQQIVKDLRDFARLDENVVVEADINAGVESTVNIVRGRARKKNVSLELQLGQLAPLTCSLSKVNQVVMNLVSNAIDACREDGHVTVRTFEQGGHVCVAVSDDGSGVEPGLVGRIFDPFFTTKPQGEGVGLGLSISYGIARDHGGTIEVDSSLGKGSTFTLKLPRPRDQAAGGLPPA